jgi:hypothetical protein
VQNIYTYTQTENKLLFLLLLLLFLFLLFFVFLEFRQNTAVVDVLCCVNNRALTMDNDMEKMNDYLRLGVMESNINKNNK